MKFVLYKDAKKEWRWRLVATNGKTIADSGEGYKLRGKCQRMIDHIILNIHKAHCEIE